MSSKVYTGQLDQRITFIENTRVNTTTGSKETTPEAIVTCWAKVEDVSGNEDEDGKIRALNVRRYTILYNPVLAEKQITDLYINDDNQLYNIYAVSFIGRKQYIELKCSKRA